MASEFETPERRAEQVFGSLVAGSVREGADLFEFTGGDGNVWQGELLRDEHERVVFATATAIGPGGKEMNFVTGRSFVIFNSGKVSEPALGVNSDNDLVAAEVATVTIRPH